MIVHMRALVHRPLSALSQVQTENLVLATASSVMLDGRVHDIYMEEGRVVMVDKNTRKRKAVDVHAHAELHEHLLRVTLSHDKPRVVFNAYVDMLVNFVHAMRPQSCPWLKPVSLHVMRMALRYLNRQDDDDDDDD
jgi:hypothetical protein